MATDNQSWIDQLTGAVNAGLGTYQHYQEVTGRNRQAAPPPTPNAPAPYMAPQPAGMNFGAMFAGANKPLLYGSVALLAFALAKKFKIIK